MGKGIKLKDAASCSDWRKQMVKLFLHSPQAKGDCIEDGMTYSVFHNLISQYLWLFSCPWWSYNYQKTWVNQHGEIDFFWTKASGYWCYSILFELCHIKWAARWWFPNGSEHTRWDRQSLDFFNPVPPVFLELSKLKLICSLLEIYM